MQHTNNPTESANPSGMIYPTNLVTFGASITRPEALKTMPIQNLMAQMQSGNWRKQIEAIRAEKNPKLRSELKQRLPYFIYGVVEGKRLDENVRQLNGIVFDFDHLPNIDAFKETVLLNVPWARWIFRSPVDGLKVVIPFSREVFDRKEYSAVWYYLRKELKERTGIEPDNTPDLCRACFVSWDDDFIAVNGAEEFDPSQVEQLSKAAEENNVEQIADQQHWNAALPIDLTEHQALSAVEYLCKCKLEYRDWSRIGMALYNHFGEPGKIFWMLFADNPHYEDDAEGLSKLWDKLKKYPTVKIGTLFYIAEQHGWIDAVAEKWHEDNKIYKIGMNDSASESLSLCPSVLSEKSLADFPELLDLFRRPQNIPLDKAQLPSEINQYLDLVGKITDAQEGAKLTAMLPVIAANIGNRVYMYNAGTLHYCNIWAAIIGPSTVSRKTTVINQAMKMIKPFKDSLIDLTAKERNERDIELCRVTQARLYNLLSINPNRLILQMELSAWMQEMGKVYNAGMKQEITDMFDGKDRSIAKMEIDEYIRKPAFSIVGATTEDWFFRELREVADQRGGFLQRFIICIIQNIDVNELRFESNVSPEHDKDLYAWDEMLSVFRGLPDSHRLLASEEALAYRNGIYTELMKSIALNANDPQAAYCARIFDNYFWRFCILIHLLKNWQDLREARDNDRLQSWFTHNKVDEQTAREAWYLCEYYFQNTQPFLKSLAEDSRLENERKVIRIMQKAPEQTLTHSRLLCKSRLTSREFRTCMESLIERQAVIAHDRKAINNKIAFEYVLNPVLIGVDVNG